jgi:hypothetical protein
MTKLYVYENVDPVSTNYHSGGGVVIVTDREPEEAWADYVRDAFPITTDDRNYDRIDKHEQERFFDGLTAPQFIAELAEDTPEMVTVFPDSGCC